MTILSSHKQFYRMSWEDVLAKALQCEILYIHCLLWHTTQSPGVTKVNLDSFLHLWCWLAAIPTSWPHLQGAASAMAAVNSQMLGMSELLTTSWGQPTPITSLLVGNTTAKMETSKKWFKLYDCLAFMIDAIQGRDGGKRNQQKRCIITQTKQRWSNPSGLMDW